MTKKHAFTHSLTHFLTCPATRSLDSKFKQQQLPAWKPILTPKTTLPLFYVIGVIFIIFGAVLLVASNAVRYQRRQWCLYQCANDIMTITRSVLVDLCINITLPIPVIIVLY